MGYIENGRLPIRPVVFDVPRGVVGPQGLFYNEPRLRVMGLYGCVQKSAAVGTCCVSVACGGISRSLGLDTHYTAPI